MVDLVLAGLLLVFAGVAVIMVAVFREGTKGGNGVRGGGVVMIGPVPIIFGSDMKWASVAIALAIVLIVVAFLLTVI